MFLTSGELVRLMTVGIVLRDSKNMADSIKPHVEFFQGHSEWRRQTFYLSFLRNFVKWKNCISETINIIAVWNTAPLERHGSLTFVLSLQKIPRNFVAAYSTQFFTHVEQKLLAPGGYRLLTSCSITWLLHCVPCDTSCCSVSLYLYFQESLPR